MIDLRHLRYFLALAEELHFGRAAERLHIEQSPLSRTIKELEEELGVTLFSRSTRGTRLTPAGARFLENVPRVFAALEQANVSAQDVAAGYCEGLRIALSDSLTPARLAILMASSREKDPATAIHLTEVPLAQQVKGLHENLYDLGLAQSSDVGANIIAEPAWHDPIHVVLPARHPLLALSHVPLDEVIRHPLVLGDPQHCEGYCRQIDRLLRTADLEPQIFQRVHSVNLMITIVSAGFALALVGLSQAAGLRELGVVTRPLACSTMLTTWLLRTATEPSMATSRFIERVIDLRDTQGDFQYRFPNVSPPDAGNI